LLVTLLGILHRALTGIAQIITYNPSIPRRGRSRFATRTDETGPLLVQPQITTNPLTMKSILSFIKDIVVTLVAITMIILDLIDEHQASCMTSLRRGDKE